MLRKILDHLKRHWLKYIIIPVLYFGALAFIFNLSEDNFHHTISGVTYRLGDESSYALTQIEFVGRRSKSFFRKGKFEGSIIFDEYELDVSIHLDDDNSAYLQGWITDDDDDYATIGELFADNNFEALTLCIYEKGEGNSRSWNSATGLMFSGPAVNREEALEISNKQIHSVMDLK